MEWLEMAGAVLVLMAGAVALPWLWARVGAEKLKTVWKWTCVSVQAAEQIFGSETGERKKAYVREFLRGKGLRLDEKTLEALLEAAVRELT